jgi:hypothetical protein
MVAGRFVGCRQQIGAPMIISPVSMYENTFKCSRRVMNYLVYERHLPVFGMQEHFYYFAKTDELEKALNEMPLYLKIINKVAK